MRTRIYGDAFFYRRMREYGRLVKSASGAFDRLRVYTCRNTPDIMVFNANAEKEKKQSACSQIISAFLLRKYVLSVKAA